MHKVKRKKRVVIAHAPEDKSTAKRLAEDLRHAHLNTWLDEEQLFPGQHWKDELSQAVSEADGILLLLSPHAASTRGRLQEQLLYTLTAARDTNTSAFILPVRLEESLEADNNVLMPSGIRVDLFPSWEKGIKDLLKAIEDPGLASIEMGGHPVNKEVSPPAIFLAWDPDILEPEEYAALIAALGDLVRAEGGMGIERLNDGTFELTVSAGVFA